ncbi:MAG TPA: YihY/virulence factor BrkB family protein [Vicinamibacterales bacterium]|jgi:membrane protein
MSFIVERVTLYLRLTSAAAWHALKRFYSGHDLTYAASIAYWALLSLFPFLLLIMSLVGAATAEDADRTAVIQFALDYFPTRVEFVTRQLDAFRQTPLQLGIAGVAGLTWASLGFFGSVSTAVNYAWGVETPRSFLKHRLFAFLMLVTAGLMFVVAMVMVSAVPIIEASWFAQVLSRFPGLLVLQSLAARWISTVLLIIVLGFIYYFVPNAKVRFRHVWVGAVLTGFVWRAAFAGFSWYIGDVSELSRIHGSIAAVVIFLFWIYVSAVILLYGVQFTAAYGRLRSGHRLEAAVEETE